jgi:Protein of unknown function (DUF3046)
VLVVTVDPQGRGSVAPVRLTDFWSRMDQHLGPAYSRSWAHDVVLAELGGRTVDEALAAGLETKDVWRAVVAQLGLPARER